MWLLRITMCLLCGLASARVVRPSEPEIRLAGEPGRPTAVEVSGLSKAVLAELAKRSADDPLWPNTLAIYVVDDAGANLVPMLGSYEVTGTTLRFAPHYSLRRGLTYRVVVRGVADESFTTREIAKEFSIPAAPPTAPTTVTAIYPSASTLPDNQLRFYIHFSAPMSAGQAYTHIKLLQANGQIVSRAFLEIGEELWDGSGQRLTLLLDPGRVKKGLKPREEFGPVLTAGQSYRLVIDKNWRDANNQSLAAGFEKRFTAGPPIETAVRTADWRVSPPAAATRDALVVRFPRPLDRALLLRMITVADASQQQVAGKISLADEERRWEFRPDRPWKAGAFALVVDTALEDSAGNNITRPFEVDVFDRVDDKVGPEVVRIPFSVAATQSK